MNSSTDSKIMEAYNNIDLHNGVYKDGWCSSYYISPIAMYFMASTVWYSRFIEFYRFRSFLPIYENLNVFA